MAVNLRKIVVPTNAKHAVRDGANEIVRFDHHTIPVRCDDSLPDAICPRVRGANEDVCGDAPAASLDASIGWDVCARQIRCSA